MLYREIQPTPALARFVECFWTLLPNSDFVMETSFVPELGGGIPFKRVYTYDDGRRIVEEPLALVMGEPQAADLSGPEYQVIEQLPVFDKELGARIISQPAPVFPADADTGGFGNTVFVSVIIDEDGRVLNATANTSITFLRRPGDCGRLPGDLQTSHLQR